MNTSNSAKIALTAQRRRVERRQARRLAPGRLTPCTIQADGGDEIPGWVHNLSVAGAGANQAGSSSSIVG